MKIDWKQVITMAVVFAVVLAAYERFLSPLVTKK
jgi:hypothetical protein